MVTNKEIQLIAKELNLYNISNGTIDLEDEKVSNKEYLYNILLQEINISKRVHNFCERVEFMVY